VITPERGALLAVFQAHLGYTFHNLALLNQALTHRSYAYEVSGNDGDYERLEFLGDAVLNLLVSAYVFTTQATAREGPLSTSAVFYCSVAVRTSTVGVIRIPCWRRP
jgi:ribonuclease-3